LLTAIRERPTGQTVFDAFATLVGEPGGLLAASDMNVAQRLLEISQVINDSPALLAREQQILARYTDSLTDLIANETRAGADDPRPAVTAAALIGVHRTLIDHVRRHLLAGDDLPLARNTRQSPGKHAHLEHGWDVRPKLIEPETPETGIEGGAEGRRSAPQRGVTSVVCFEQTCCVKSTRPAFQPPIDDPRDAILALTVYSRMLVYGRRGRRRR
jgi:hypothetical protein